MVIRRCVIAAAILVAASLSLVAGGGQSGDPSTLTGIIDIHTHSAPDSTSRLVDVFDLARAAHASGMRGIVVKNHYESTASVAFLVRKIVPGLEVFGGITMDLANGGVNPAAVENMAKVTGGWGRVVWMPTFDSEAAARLRPASADPKPYASVSKGGELLPETRRVISLIASNQLVLATGHSSAAEHILLAREGERQGLRRHMVITHAPSTPGGMTIAQMQETAKAGAFIEICALSIVGARPTAKASEYANIVRQVGAQSVIMSTDLGQPENPLHTTGMASFIAAMRREGIPQSAIEQMTRSNPAELLRLQ
jgi:hypothetical protein